MEILFFVIKFFKIHYFGISIMQKQFFSSLAKKIQH
jgi:hypothetical protein